MNIDVIKSGGYIFQAVQVKSGEYELRISKDCAENPVFCAEKPAAISVFDINGNKTDYEAKYGSISFKDHVLTCVACVKTENGSSFLIKDEIKDHDNTGSCVVERTVSVESVDGRDRGFYSQFNISFAGSVPFEKLNFFVPGIWYKKNEDVVKGAFAYGKYDMCSVFRNTRMALPFVMAHEETTGNCLSICHLAPTPDTGIPEISSGLLIDDSLQYSSLGVTKRPDCLLSYLFPGTEGEINYMQKDKAWAYRGHPVKKGIVQEYKFMVKAGTARDYNHAMVQEWRYYVRRYHAEIVPCDLGRVYQIGVDLLDTYCQKYNGTMGIPFWTTVPAGQVSDISFQFGFVGQQPQAAYQLLKYGFEHGNEELIYKGTEIVNFWVAESMNESGIPNVWYEVFPKKFRDHPCYLRIAADGAEGIINAWNINKKHNIDKPEWLEFCRTFANFLVRVQNEDGSYYRAYNPQGDPIHFGKANTTNPIRFLVRMYWLTGEKAYLQAALKAGEYSYENIYLTTRFVGGTADNDNTIDKEAGILAMYAFLALYDEFKEQKWLDAAKCSADFCESWVYMWDFPVYPKKGNCVFDKVSITGLSLIATGHSHSDVFMAYCAFDFFRLYLLTDDKHYLYMSKILLHNTKQTTDWSGKLGHEYPGLVEESGELALQYHNGLGKWLPWCTIAEIEPMTRLKDWFGDMDIDKLFASDLSRLKECNNSKLHMF